MKQNHIIEKIQYENKCKFCSEFNGPNCSSRTPEREACENFVEGDIIYNLCQGGNKADDRLLRGKLQSRFSHPTTFYIVVVLCIVAMEMLLVSPTDNIILALLLNISLSGFMICLSLVLLNKASLFEREKKKVNLDIIQAVVWGIIYIAISLVGREYWQFKYNVLYAFCGAFPFFIVELAYALSWKKDIIAKRKGHWVYVGRQYHDSGMYNFIKVYDDEDEDQVILSILSGYENFPVGIQKAANLVNDSVDNMANTVYSTSASEKIDSAVDLKNSVSSVKDALDEMYHKEVIMNETGGYNGVDNRYPGINA